MTELDQRREVELQDKIKEVNRRLAAKPGPNKQRKMPLPRAMGPQARFLVAKAPNRKAKRQVIAKWKKEWKKFKAGKDSELKPVVKNDKGEIIVKG